MGENRDTKKLNEQLTAVREAKRQEHHEWEAKLPSTQRKKLFEALRRASKEEYQEWLAGYLESGGTITHSYDYPWGRWIWYVVLKDVELIPLYGSNSINIIVPHGIKVTGEPGHSTVFWMEGFKADSTVPIFSDIGF